MSVAGALGRIRVILGAELILLNCGLVNVMKSQLLLLFQIILYRPLPQNHRNQILVVILRVQLSAQVNVDGV